MVMSHLIIEAECMAGFFTVRDVMTRDFKAVGRDTNMQAVVDIMLEFDISSVVIV
jgi:CBS domain-containing protein